MNWEEACAAPSLLNLPYKIELNEWGTIMMSPVSLQHSYYAKEIGILLEEFLEGGFSLLEAAVETTKGTRVPDVAWFTRKHWQKNKGNFAASTAPMICVEVLSPSNAWGEMEEKKALFFAAGAEEVWVCVPDGKMRFFTTNGEIKKSEIAPGFPLEIILD
ncbi:MAG: Uma2 family endonuclease [SAR324 cluster bacterium]|jgi:Uma2 family endonuclease|nr:Uma2 family endonuclease [SAR324 cluster bacterium]